MSSRNETWPVPYISRLEGSGFQPGQSLVLRGVVLGETFTINLSSGRNYEEGTPFHMSVRPKSKEIVLNSYQGAWEKEVKKKCSYKDGDEFDIRIRAHDSNFEIFVDQKELATFDYRYPLATIDHLIIDGAIALHAVNWGGKYYPVPYEAGIEGGFTPGKKLYVSGMPEGKRFDINLLVPNGNIALHVSIRYDQKAIVRNDRRDGAWGPEETEGKMPIDKNHAFDVIVENKQNSYHIYVNGNHFCAFAHRADARDVNGLRIEGDVELQGVHIK